MLSRIRPRLNHATIVAYLALFVALGGSSYSAVKISGKNIKNKSIAGKKLKNRTIGGKKVKKNALGGTEINESKLGTVPNANHASTASSAGTASRASTANVASGLAAPERYREVGAAGQPAFQNSCVNAGGNLETVAFFKDHDGVVHLKGTYTSCSSSAHAFQLPTGYRPASDRQLDFPMAIGTGHVTVVGSGFGATFDGAVFCDGGGFCYLDGITFRAAS